MSITLDEFGDDVEKELINCSSCNTQLLLLEHSPFESSYYIYCDSCPTRMDISIYDKKYNEVEAELIGQNENFYEGDDALNVLLSKLEKFLKPCKCGGHFKVNSKIRCLSCVDLLGEYPDYMNIWYIDDFDEECEDGRKETYIVESEWL